MATYAARGPDEVPQDRRDAVRAPHDEEWLGCRAVVLEDQADDLVGGRGHAPPGPAELALLEVADGVGGVEPVALEEVAQERPVRGRPGDHLIPSAKGHGHHQPTAASAGDANGPVVARLGRPALDGRGVRGAQTGLERRPDDALLGHEPGDQLGRGDVEGRIADLGAQWCDAHPANDQELVRVALLDRDGRPVRGVEIDRTRGCGDVERDPVTGRQDGQRVRAHLVGRVAVGGHPVRPDDDGVDLAARHQVAGRDIRDEGVRHARPGPAPRPVSRAPWRYGRVSSTQTWMARPA